MTADVEAWRPKQLQRLVKWLEKGERIVLIGGPGLGKRFLGLALSDHPRELVLSIGMGGFAEQHPNARRVPLSNLPKHQVVAQWGEDAFSETAGHPGLLAGWLRGDLSKAREHYGSEYANLGAEHPEHWKRWTQLRARAESATDRYVWAVDQGMQKADLDWLSCAGLIARSIHGDRAGIVCLPLD